MESNRKTGFNNCGLNKLHQISVVCILAGTFGNLQNQRCAKLGSGFGNPLHDFHVVDVECTDCITAVIRFFKHLSCRYQWHISNSPLKKIKFVQKVYLQICVSIISSFPAIINKMQEKFRKKL